MNQVQTAEFCRLLREYVMAQDSASADHAFDMSIEFRMSYGWQDDCDPDVCRRMSSLTGAAIRARYELMEL